VFTLHIAPVGTAVYLADPLLVKQVFQGSTAIYHAGEGNQILGAILGRRSVLLLDEEEHLGERRRMLPAFHGERVARTVELMAGLTRAEVARWPRHEPFALHERMRVLTLAIIVRVVFGVTDPARATALAAALTDVTDIKPWHMPAFASERVAAAAPWRVLRRRRAVADRLIAQEVEHHLAAGGLEERDDVLSMLLLSADGDATAARDQLMTLLLAGHETTASGLAWTFERLLRHPAQLARVQAGLGDDRDPYRDAVVKESLRVRPVIHDVARRLTEPVQVGKWPLPEGTVVLPSIGLLHADDRLHPDAAAFRPERWLEGGESSPYAWIPFGGGTRRCLGATFATTEMATVLRTVLQEVTLHAPDPADEPQRMSHITIVPTRGTLVEAA
jgi:cytochrome P450